MPNPKEAKRWPRGRGLWRELVLKAYATHGTLEAAAQAAGTSRRTIARLLAKDERFRARMDEAREVFVDSLEEEVDRRAFEGVERPVFQGGKLVGHVREFSDRLAELRLKALRPEKYADRRAVQASGPASFTVRLGIQTRDGDPRPPACRRKPPEDSGEPRG